MCRRAAFLIVFMVISLAGSETIRSAGAAPEPPPAKSPAKESPSVVPSPPQWKSANFVFPAGTRSIRIHFNDPYTYRTNREVRIGVQGTGNTWGWSTWVYPDSVARKGPKNPTFYLGGAGEIGVTPGTPIPAIQPGQLYSGTIECQQAKRPTYFGFSGFDGEMIIDDPVTLVRGPRRWLFRLRIGQKTNFTFAVAPGPGP